MLFNGFKPLAEHYATPVLLLALLLGCGLLTLILIAGAVLSLVAFPEGAQRGQVEARPGLARPPRAEQALVA